MDLSKVIEEPHRKKIEEMFINLWFTCAFVVQSHILRCRIENMIKEYGHLAGIASAEYSVSQQTILINFYSGRSDRITWDPKKTILMSIREAQDLINEFHQILWGMLTKLRMSKSKETMH